ncbi:MAG: HAMP domain-containing protein [Sedimentisphaerales bacterium]|nr:HAMP domain-containing protein [Sedimentisphaerales bacterium]
MIFKSKKTRTSFRSLWVTLAIAFLALSAVVLLIASSSNIYISFRTQQKLITNEQRFIAQNAADSVKDFVRKKLDLLKTVTAITNLSSAEPQEQKLILERLLGEEPAFRQVLLLSAEGREAARISRLSNLVSGQFTKHLGDNLLAKVSAGKTYIGPVYINEVTSEPLIAMAVPVTDVFNDFKGALLAEVNLKFMWDLVGSMKIGDSGLAYVVDKQGTLIAFGDISRVLKGENIMHLNEVNEFVKGDLLIHKDSADAVKGILGNRVVANHVHLETPDWAVVVELPVLEAYKTVTTALVISLSIILLSFALAIIAGIYLSKRITKPIISLRDAAVKIGQGRLDTKIEIKKNDEIGDLASAFNQMLRDLQKTTTSIDNLNKEIAEREKTEDALRKNEEFTKRIIESSSDCIKVLDLQGNLLSISEGGQKLLELDDAAPFINTSFIDFWKGREKETCLEAVEKAKKGDKGVFYGYFETAKGNPKWWEVIITPIKDADGSINRLLAVSRDITERKRAEKSLEKLNKDLKSTVIMLTQSNKQLQEFVHSAAHDLKTPLRGIGTLAQWLVDDYKDKFDSPGQRKVNLLVERVERINKLINAIMYYSTIAREKHKEHPVDLNVLVRNIITDIKPPGNIKVTIGRTLPVVIGEGSLLRQVFYHLIANAVNFMNKPEGSVTVGCVDRNTLWEFSVADNGPGIAQQHFDRIFRLFQTLDGNIGTGNRGVGLTVVKKIVELYDGRIWLTSEIGQGSTFFFTLPKVFSSIDDEKLLFAKSS